MSKPPEMPKLKQMRRMRLDDPFYRGGDVVGVLVLRGKLPDSSPEPRVIDAMN
jgi:hypothetical protein